jgi:hypothetical protein
MQREEGTNGAQENQKPQAEPDVDEDKSQQGLPSSKAQPFPATLMNSGILSPAERNASY